MVPGVSKGLRTVNKVNAEVTIKMFLLDIFEFLETCVDIQKRWHGIRFLTFSPSICLFYSNFTTKIKGSEIRIILVVKG